MTTTNVAPSIASSSRLGRLALVALGPMFLPMGVQATLFPRSFFDDFPLGRGWVAAGGDAYNEHLVRDVGVFFLALVIISLWAWRQPALQRPVAVAWLVQSIPHLIYHSGHLHGLGGFDKVALIGSLVAAPLLAVVALVATSTASDSGTTQSTR